jgi:hypothetical protein
MEHRLDAYLEKLDRDAQEAEPDWLEYLADQGKFTIEVLDTLVVVTCQSRGQILRGVVKRNPDFPLVRLIQEAARECRQDLIYTFG